jgi:hypothetical protein
MTTVRRLAVSCAAIVILAGCSLAPGAATAGIPVPYPAGCATFELDEPRCDAVVDELAARAGIDPWQASEIWLLGDVCGDGTNVLCARSGSFVVRVRFVLGDGGTVEESLICGVGSSYSYLCTDDPEILVVSPIGGGYHDVPCAGDPPDGCATPVPSAAPDAIAAARPLEVTVLDVPIDREGAWDVLVGEAVLPNGLLTDATLTLADPSPDDVFMQQPVWLDIRSVDDGSRLSNIYEHGWREGTERVEVRLQFDVDRFAPGAVLQVRDLVVR